MDLKNGRIFLFLVFCPLLLKNLFFYVWWNLHLDMYFFSSKFWICIRFFKILNQDPSFFLMLDQDFIFHFSFLRVCGPKQWAKNGKNWGQKVLPRFFFCKNTPGNEFLTYVLHYFDVSHLYDELFLILPFWLQRGKKA